MKQPKYRNKKTVLDGFTFDSQKEANRYLIYKDEKERKRILDFKMQVKYKFIINGQLVCSYVSDFVIKHLDGRTEVIDVKSEATRKLPVYRIKKKLMKAIYNIEVKEV